MKSAVLTAARQIEIQNLPVPHAGPDDVVVRVGACGLCGTDQHIFEGSAHFPIHYPLVPGHEMAGEIVEVGSSISHLKAGDRVALDPNINCGHCFWCLRGEVNLCANMQALGVTRSGGFAEYCLSPARQAVPLPLSLDIEYGGLAEPLACCLRGADRMDVKPGDTVAILGGGFIGLVLLQLANLAGASMVIVSEPSQHRREMAEKFGAIAVEPADLSDTIEELTEGIGADVTVESAGRVETAEQTVDLVRRGGRILFFGVVPEHLTARIKPFDIYRKELTILGSFVNPFTHARAVQLLAEGKLDVKDLVSHRFKVEDFATAMETARTPDAVKVVITP